MDKLIMQAYVDATNCYLAGAGLPPIKMPEYKPCYECADMTTLRNAVGDPECQQCRNVRRREAEREDREYGEG